MRLSIALVLCALFSGVNAFVAAPHPRPVKAATMRDECRAGAPQAFIG